MPQVTEEQALEAINLAEQTEDPVYKQRLGDLVAGYKSQQEKAGAPLFPAMAKREAEGRKRERAFFQDRETHGLDDEQRKLLAQSYVNNEEGKASFFVDQHLAREYQRSTKDIRPIRTQYRDEYSKARWGNPVTTDKEFYDKLGADFDTEDAVNDYGQTAALRDLNPLIASAQMPDEIKESDAFKGRSKAFKETFARTFQNTQKRVAPYRGIITETVEDLQEKTGVSEGEEDGGSYRDFAKRLMDVPEKDRNLVLGAIIANAGDGESKGAAQKLAENFGRGAQDIYFGNISTISRNSLLQAKGQIHGIQNIPEGVTLLEHAMNVQGQAMDTSGAGAIGGSIEGISANTQPVTDEQRAEAAELIENGLDAVELHEQLRGIADNNIDPAKGENIVTNGLYQATRSIPYTLSAMTGTAGFLATSNALANDSYKRLRAENPEMTREQANAISNIAAPFQAALEKVSGNILKGKLPGVDRLFNQVALKGSSIAARGATRAVSATGIELLQENAQDITPFVVQQTLAALQEDVPEVPWESVLGGMAEGQGELFFAVLPLALIGAGVGTHSDVKGARDMLGDYDMLRATGISEAAASEIRGSAIKGDMDAAQSQLREEFKTINADSKPVQEVRAEVFQKAITEKIERAKLIDSGIDLDILPALRKQEGGFSLQFNDGTQGPVYESYEEADTARWQFASDNNLSIHEATRNVIQTVEKQIEEGREIKYVFSAENRTLRDAQESGEVTEEAAQNRVDISDELQTEQEAEVDIETEFEKSNTAANLAATAAEDRLANSYILGSNKTEYAEGIERTTIKLYQQASPITIIEEKLEGDATVMIKRGQRNWMVSALREYEAVSGDKVFLKDKTDEDLTNGDIKEAWSHLGQSYFVGRSRKGDAGDKWGSSSFRDEAAKLMSTKLGGAYTAYGQFFRAVWKRAAKVNKLRREGKLDKDLEREIARSVGLDEQQEFSESVETEAATIKGELEPDFDLSSPANVGDDSSDLADEDAPFSVISAEQDTDYLAAVEGGDMEAAQGMVDQAAKAAGYDSEVFKGMPVKDWETGKIIDTIDSPNGIWAGFFSSSESVAEDFAKTFGMWLNPAPETQIVRAGVKLDLNNVLEIDANNETAGEFQVDAHQFIEENPRWRKERSGEPKRIHDALEQGKSVVIRNTSDEQDVYIVRNANQVKRLDTVTYDSSGNVIPLSQRFDSGRDEISFSTISNPEQRIAAMFSPFQRSPELRVKLGQEMQRRSARESQKWAPIIAARKSKKEINEARKEKESELIQEKLETLTPATIGALESGATLDDTAQRPILTNLLSRKTYTRKDGKVVGYWAGSLLSKSKAKKQGKNVNEYDDIENMNLPPYIWGGNTLPDQAAASLGFDSVTEFWTELEKEIESFREVTEATKEAESTIRELEKEAKAEAKQWADELQEQSDVVGTDRANLLAGLRTLEAIKSALPAEVAGRIGGVTKLASLNTPASMLKEIERITQRIDKELEKYLKKEADKLVKKLLEKTSKPAKDEAGKLRKGKAGADIHSLFDVVRDVWKQGWSMERAEGHALGLELEIEKGELTAEQEAHKLLEAEMVRMFGGWADKDSADRTNAYQEAQEIWTHAYHEWKEKKAREKEHRDEVRADLIQSTGKKGTGGEKDLAEISGVTPKGKAKEFAFSLLNFDQLVSWTFGKESKWAKWFADTEREAENAKRDAITETVNSVEDLFTDLAGGDKFKGEKLQFKMSRKSIEATDAKGDVRKLSELEVVTALLMWQQEDGKRHMRGRKDEAGNIDSSWSYDEDFIDELSGKLSNDAWQVLGFLNAQYGGEYEGLNAVYKELYGVNLPQNPNYSPLTMNPIQAKNGETVDPVTGTTSSSGSFTPGSLRSRGVAIAEPQFRDAITTFVAHKKQIEHWKAYAVFTRDANAILGNRDVSNSAIAAHGQESVSIIRKWLDAFAQGGTRDAAAGIAMNRGLQKWIGNAQSMALVGRLGTVAVQATQLGAAAAKMPTGAYLKRLGQLLTGNLGWKTALNSDYIQRRLSEQPVIIQQAMEGLKAGKPTQLRHQVAKIGKLIGGADALFTAGTFAMVYDYQHSQAIKAGASKQDAATLAKSEAERITDEIAQPTRMGARSFMEVSATNPMLKLAWAFGSESRKNLALMVYSGAKGTAAEKAQAALYVVLLNGLMASVIRAAWRDARDDDDDEVFDERNWSPKRLALATSTDWLFGFPVVGEGAQKAIFSLAGEYTFDGNLMDPVKDLGTAPIKLFTGESSNELRDLEKILTALGLFNNNMASATSLMHLLRDAVGATKNFTGG